MQHSNPEAPYLGRHIIAEFFECDKDQLSQKEALTEAMNEAARTAGATILSTQTTENRNGGVSVVVIIQESNLCLHTWPKEGYASADFFTCGDSVNPWQSYDFLKQVIKAGKSNCMEVKRGETKIVTKGHAHSGPEALPFEGAITS